MLLNKILSFSPFPMPLRLSSSADILSQTVLYSSSPEISGSGIGFSASFSVSAISSARDASFFFVSSIAASASFLVSFAVFNPSEASLPSSVICSSLVRLFFSNCSFSPNFLVIMDCLLNSNLCFAASTCSSGSACPQVGQTADTGSNSSPRIAVGSVSPSHFSFNASVYFFLACANAALWRSIPLLACSKSISASLNLFSAFFLSDFSVYNKEVILSCSSLIVLPAFLTSASLERFSPASSIEIRSYSLEASLSTFSCFSFSFSKSRRSSLCAGSVSSHSTCRLCSFLICFAISSTSDLAFLRSLLRAFKISSIESPSTPSFFIHSYSG